MKIDLLSRIDLTRANKENYRYPLAVAEKDYFLALLLQIIYSSTLKNKLVFKGGTAIHHLYLDQLRFSEDLDFTALEPVSIDDLEEVFKPYNFLEIIKFYPSNYALKIERLKFLGPLGQANSIKIDINLEQKLILPAGNMSYKNIFGVPITVQAMALEEICAEKIRAINERVRYRDFYDLAMVLRNTAVDQKAILKILAQKEQRKPFSRDTISANLETAEESRIAMTENLYYREEIGIAEIEKTIGELFDLI